MGCCVTKSSRDNFQFESQWNSQDIRVGFPPRMTTITIIVDGICKTVKEVKHDLLVNSNTEEGENLDLFLIRSNRKPKLLEDDREFIEYKEYIMTEGDESYLQFYPRKPADEKY
ncbi:uncharacterized protein LOC106050700 [Biomphalaria glabrata]|uniref:Uncharacterized protein LOC106050700 n=1 Tax=Biomphalaria glabrata TaxID=6526 RepID=A0A9W2YWW7_BIOGL|nr:uncharacterized protein LOC106050700 [Biomphalaria glabrata]XP_055867212.1 uncharacterized protein LOC106050700 [Biomphalaria glabrata]XP_055867213.1 uncharacterized protein LOC106050700 [Biomphalaria glabrata]XP_055867214.1 uncharacterized protein LOC106050700 [Biomphalaria glabrata]